VGLTDIDEIDESEDGISGTNENDECEEMEFVDMGLYVLLAIVILRVAANVGRTLIQYKLLKVFASGFVGYQFFKWVPTLRNLGPELDDSTIESYLEYYFGASTSSIDLLEDLEPSDANESHRVGTQIETNGNDRSELGSSDTNETDERKLGLSECDADESNENDESEKFEVDESDESEAKSSEAESSDMDESGEIEVGSNDEDEGTKINGSKVESNDIDQSDDYVVVPLLHGRFGAK
jgi:hypothetical protein